MVIWSIRWQICYIVSVTSRRALQNLVNHSNAIDLENVFIPTRNCFTKTGDLMFFFCHTNGPVYFLRHPRIIAKCEMCRSYKFYKNTFDNNNINIQLNWRVRERANMSHELIIFVTKWYDKKKYYNNDDRITWKYFVCIPVYQHLLPCLFVCLHFLSLINVEMLMDNWLQCKHNFKILLANKTFLS